MSNDLKWLMCSDLHFPYHSPRRVELVIKVTKWFKPDAFDITGDADDSDSTSRWAEGTPDEKISVLDAGVSGTKNFLQEINDIIPNADKHLHDGNHGWYRHKKYLERKAPQFLDVVNPDVLYEHSKNGFDFHYYDAPPVKRFGDIYVHHGESISKNAGESVRNDVLNWGISLVRSHSHRQGSYFKTYNMTGQKLRGYEIGHLCDETAMDYSLAKDWQPGFAIAHVVNDYPHIQLIQINDNYECVVDGKTFKA
jgi:hypothetical protein